MNIPKMLSVFRAFAWLWILIFIGVLALTLTSPTERIMLELKNGGFLFSFLLIALSIYFIRSTYRNPRGLRIAYTISFIPIFYITFTAGESALNLLVPQIFWLLYFWFSGGFKRWVLFIEDENCLTPTDGVDEKSALQD